MSRTASANLERGTSRSASAEAISRSRFGLNFKRAHPPIPPRGCAAGCRRHPANLMRLRLKFALAVRGWATPATLGHVAAGPLDARAGHNPRRSPHAPTWAAWVTHVAAEGALGAAANRYSGGNSGPRRRREQPQTPTDLLPIDRRTARGPRRSPTLATCRAVAPSPRPDRPSPHGPTWAAVAAPADRRRPVHPAPAWRHVP